ncbi:MAG: caspase family protein [Planctomycetota bacterium]
MNPLVPLVLSALWGSLPAQEPKSAEPTRSARVLLVGCTEYPYLKKEGGKVAGSNTIELSGPVNDVELFAKTLEQVFAVPPSRMTKLAGWPEEESARPTKANIVRALQELERAAQKGEWIVIYMAGHGSQQPSSSESLSDEPDGLDEVFLPADVRPSPDGEKIPHGLSDDEIADLVRRIRAKGADVWLVIDSCHSGTMLRGGGADDVVLRFVAPDRLGVRGAGGRKRNEAPAAAKPSDALTTDGIVAFYGAQSFGSAPEMKLPPDAENPEPHGLYTYLLARELHKLGSTASYRELSSRVTAAYQAFPCNLTVPLAEGDLSQIVGSGARAATPPLLLTIGNASLRLDHGMLAGIEPGVVLEVQDPAAPAGPAVARVEVARAGLHDAEVELKSGTLPAAPATCIARIHSRSLSEFRLSIALVAADEKPVGIEKLPEAARLVLQEKASRFPIVADPKAADWRIVVDGARIHLRAAGHVGSADILDVPPRGLGEKLEQLLKVHNLRRLCGLFPPTGEAVQVRVECRARAGEAARRLKSGDQLRPGEEIRVLLQKSADAIYDVTVLYLDANWNVLCLYPESGRSARLEREARAEFELTDWVTVTDDALGSESVWVMAIPRGPSDPEVNLSWIAGQEVLTRGALEQDAARKVFGDLLKGPVTRGLGSGKAAPPDGSLFQIPITTSWPGLGAPPWGRAARKPIEKPLACLADLPLPVELGTFWSKFESAARAGSEGVLLIGTEKAPQAVLIDLRGKFEGSDPSAFHSQAAFLFPESGTRLALYDRKEPGGFDLCLEDGDGDGMAERRWTKTGSTWTLEERVAVPWLSQSYIGAVPDKVKATACLRILARE